MLNNTKLAEFVLEAYHKKENPLPLLRKVYPNCEWSFEHLDEQAQAYHLRDGWQLLVTIEIGEDTGSGVMYRQKPTARQALDVLIEVIGEYRKDLDKVTRTHGGKVDSVDKEVVAALALAGTALCYLKRFHLFADK